MTNSDESKIDKDEVYQAVALTICAIAVILNVIVVVVVAKFGRSTSSVDIFIVNLSVSDILHAGLIIPIYFKKAESADKDFFGDNVTCKFIMFVPLVTIMVSISTMVAVAIDRYRVMVLRKFPLSTKALWVVVTIWIISVLVSAPQLYEYNLYNRFNEEENKYLVSCGSEDIAENFEEIYSIIVLIVAYVAPLGILLFCYIRIAEFVWRNAGKTTNELEQGRNDRNPQFKRKIKVLQMLMSVTATFAILWAPYFVIFTIQEMKGHDDTSMAMNWLHVLGKMLTVVSTITNPLLYLKFSQQFRDALLNICPCRCRNNEVHPVAAGTVSTICTNV